MTPQRLGTERMVNEPPNVSCLNVSATIRFRDVQLKYRISPAFALLTHLLSAPPVYLSNVLSIKIATNLSDLSFSK